ncbi:hypothetical protein Syun_009038 [Stephania yunnanensis]|uniref:Uncharacterized protein n=1 Tax=Stephania yunnanensis TaxID=152371 RepID=A0AAP0PQ93_9MAGN
MDTEVSISPWSPMRTLLAGGSGDDNEEEKEGNESRGKDEDEGQSEDVEKSEGKVVEKRLSAKSDEPSTSRPGNEKIDDYP